MQWLNLLGTLPNAFSNIKLKEAKFKLIEFELIEA